MHEWITTDPEILGGKPCIRGTRLSVEFLLELLAGGATQPEILRAYPQLQTEALEAAIRFAARSLHNEIVWDVKIPA
jgi:uncharacterized protein (DUF433 family)